MTDAARRVARLALAAAAIVPTSCYATNQQRPPTCERGVAAANARDWDTAESELGGFAHGADCVGQKPALACKQAAVRLGEVLLEDARPMSAADAFRFAQRQFYKKALGTSDVDRDLDDRIVNGLRTIKQRWAQVRSGVSGRCQVVARLKGPSQFPPVTLWSELDMERTADPSGPPDAALLFDTVVAAGPHEIFLFATYVDPAKPGYRNVVERTLYGSCEDGERMEIVFQAHGPDALHLRIDANIYGGTSVPPDRPLRAL